MSLIFSCSRPVPSVVAYSGGLDSTVLLHLLANTQDIRERSLRAIHVHHGLHSHADDWTAHCQRFCDELGVALTIVRVEVPRDSGEGLEAAARKARYAAFESTLGENEALALAHHRDDQAETFLLRALRASGPDGLRAMQPWRQFGHGWLWRPLLDTPRAELLQYAQQHQLNWIDDPSNTNTDHDRNFLRHRVLPLLRERWPHTDIAFARSAALNAEAVELLDAEDAQSLASVRTSDPQALSVSALIKLPKTRRARVLRRWIAELNLPALPAEGITQIETELLNARSDAEAEFVWSGVIVRRWRDLLHADLVRPPLPEDWSIEWDGCAPLLLPTGDTLSLLKPSPSRGGLGGDGVVSSFATNAAPTRAKIATSVAPTKALAFDTPVRVHTRQGGERITLPGRTHSHALKNVLQDLGIPPWERARLPLLSDAAGNILAAGDWVYSANFDTWLRERDARLVWNSPSPLRRPKGVQS